MEMSEQEKAVQAEAVDRSLEGIGGWLILPAIGMVLGPVVGVVGLVYALGLYSRVAQAGYGGVFTVELLVGAALLAFAIYAAVLFFRKQRKAPRMIIILLAAGLGADLFLLVVELAASAQVFATETVKQLVRDMIGAAIWIPYFRVSKRVKATFVN
jgi:hypothetical protein